MGDTPWGRPRPDSIPVDIVPARARAPYAELPDRDFSRRLAAALASRKCVPVPTDGWYRGAPGPGGRREQAFRAVSRDLRRERAHGYLVVYETWTAYREHGTAGLAEVTLEVVMYRDGKSHGKHVELVAVVGTRGRVQWTALSVRGTVPQWDIAAPGNAPVPYNREWNRSSAAQMASLGVAPRHSQDAEIGTAVPTAAPSGVPRPT